MSLKLSICIPTYNRGAYIEQTLRSVIDQIAADVEIVVSDNASADDTQAIVQRLALECHRLRYFRWDRNMGADANFLKVVEIAAGQYCWLLGSDDRIESGGLNAVLELLESHRNLAGMTLNVAHYDKGLDRLIDVPAQTKLRNDHLFEDPAVCFETLGHSFGYLSAQVVHRDTWNSIVGSRDLRPYYNAYIHVYVIAEMLKVKPAWLYVDAKLVAWRSGNDSFLSEGLFKRLAIAVVGYEKITRDTFGKDTQVYRSMANAMLGISVKPILLSAKVNGEGRGFFRPALRLCVKTYWRRPLFWLCIFPIFAIPRAAFVWIRWLYRRVFKPLRAQSAN
jgi:abequosyltransferase